MTIGIDISQIVYEGTGVARYVREMVKALVAAYPQHTYVLFGSSWGRMARLVTFKKEFKENVRFVLLPLPVKILDFVWNRLHVLPIETITGKLDVFWSSDWVQPPAKKAKLVTTIHDVNFMKFPDEADRLIRDVQKRRLPHIVRECSMVFCDSAATKKDCETLLGIPEEKLRVVYPGGLW